MKKNLIINFHEVKDAVWFEGVIILLKSKFTMVNLSFFENSNNYINKKGFCHITFDDGDISFYTHVFPILSKYNIPATIFVSPKIAVNQENFWFQEIKGYNNETMIKLISREISIPLKSIKDISFKIILRCLPLNRINEIIIKYQTETNTLPKKCMNMSLNEILEVEKSGLVTVGAHTLNHPILKNESDENCYNEIAGSVSELQKILGHEVRYFAYPKGIPDLDFSEREINYLKKNNIVLAVSTESKFISNRDNLLSIPRLGLSHGSTKFIYIKLVLGANWESVKSIIRPSEEKIRRKIYALLKKN